MSSLRDDGLQAIQPYITQLITNDQVQRFTRSCFQHAPDYFWEIPASSSGRYHPAWALGESGLFRHTIAVMYLCKELGSTFGLTETDKDLAVCAGAIHDTFKYGRNYQVEDIALHPFFPRPYYKDRNLDPCPYALLPPNTYDVVMKAVEAHMGDIAHGTWTTVAKVKPETPLEQVVHLADYISSRKRIHFLDFL